MKASNIKLIGDKLLSTSKDPGLWHRKLSIADATTIAIAVNIEAPIVTGDKDLSYVARKLGTTVIW